MAENSAIEWCDHTFNPWEGCQKVGPGCDNCYAEARNARFGGGQAVNWGPGAPRRRTSAANWRKPLQWQRDAARFQEVHGRRQRVFCASLADVFDNAADTTWRDDLWRLIEATPDIDWLLLTKRVANVQHQVWPRWMQQGFPPNVWLGITVVDQPEADRDIIRALRLKKAAKIARLFLSIEPMLGPLQLWRLNAADFQEDPIGAEVYPLRGLYAVPDCDWSGPKVDWVICGGESGPGARPMHPDWVRSLRDQCAAAGVPFLFKQWGEWTEQDDSGLPGVRQVLEGDPEFDSEADKCDAFMALDGELVANIDDGREDVPYRGLIRLGKKRAGRELDGRTHDGFPA